MQQLWGSRFSKSPEKIVSDFNSSLSFDSKLYQYDIEGSIAHAKMLGFQGILSNEEAEQIINALNEILNEINEGKLEFNVEFEDIHTNVEKFLVEKIGEVGKKLHTARSRNDQVALDIRLYLKQEIKNIQKLLVKTVSTLVNIHHQD